VQYRGRRVRYVRRFGLTLRDVAELFRARPRAIEVLIAN
jgi:hypothetical protein